MRYGPALLFWIWVTATALAAPPRVTFERRIPALFDLGGAESVAVVAAIGDTASIEFLIEHLIEQSSRAGTLRLYDARARGLPLVLETLRRKEPADAYLAVRAYTCGSEERTADAGGRDADGNRVRRRQAWVETRCTARLDVLTATGSRTSLAIKGEGSSARVESITGEERDEALLHATRFTAIDAAEKITPRRVRESIPLDETGPAFEEGLAMIEAGRLAEARAIWQNELRRHPRVAPLRFNLAAVCEALGDRAAAERHYIAARELAPDEQRYASEYRAFVRRAD